MFKAKGALDTLRAEIDEWKEICGEREAEIRKFKQKCKAMQNGLIKEQKVNFQDEQTKVTKSTNTIEEEHKLMSKAI